MIAGIQYRGLTRIKHAASQSLCTVGIAALTILVIGIIQGKMHSNDMEVLRAERDAARSVAEIRGTCVPTGPGQIASLAIDQDGKSLICAIVDTRSRSRPANRIEYAL